MLADHLFETSSNPRMWRACVKCARVPEAHPKPEGRPRNPAAEREIVELAGRAAGLPDAVGESLWRYANGRCAPGPVRLGLDWKDEARQELGDASNYLAWWIEALEARGDDEALEDRACALHVLSAVLLAWQRLHAR